MECVGVGIIIIIIIRIRFTSWFLSFYVFNIFGAVKS